jgi:hypothetical protein
MNRPVLLIAASLSAAVLVGVLVLRRPSPAPGPEASTPPAVVESSPAVPTSPEAPAATPRPAPRSAAAPSAPDTVAPVAEAPPAAVATGTLRIDSDVPGAQVFIDRQFVGTAPVVAENVAPGSHALNVSAEGFEGIAQTIDVEAGSRDITVRFREVRLNARLAVVHKHRIGSCSGELVATAQGLRYETTSKDDGFGVGLADLEVFQVEYLDKTLRIKPRRGRQFNFTDPEGNADRLFVFHRDVDKARTRLSNGDTAAAQ